LATVSPDRVRSRLGLTQDDIGDSDVQVFINESAAYLSSEINRTLDPASCTEDEARAIANLAAIYCWLKVTGVSAVGWTANLGELTFSGAPQKVAQLQFLQKEVQMWINREKEPYVGVA